MTAKKSTKAPSKTASASSKRLQNSTKPSDELKTEQTASTEETENQNPSPSNSNQSSQTETSDPQTISSTSDDDEETTVEPDEENDGEGVDPDSDESEEETESYRPVGAPDGRIIRQGDDVVFDADRHETYAVIKEDVYQEVHLRGSKRVSYRLIYSAGTAIPLSALEEK